MSGLLRPLLGIVILLAFGVRGVADDREASSIAEFVAAQDRWNNLVGRPMRLEGRYTVFSSADLRFKNCDMKFVLTKSFRRPSATTKNIEVSGQIVRKDGGLEFRVTDLQPRESDEELLTVKRALIDSSRPENVYELAAWARRRGQFYGDDDLKKEADSLYREGLTIASERLKPDDAAGRRELARLATEFSLDPAIRLRYVHEALRVEWQAAQATQKQDYRSILGALRRDLPGATTELPADRLSIRRDYEAAPLAVYRVADGSTRELLDRAFFLEVALANVLLSADPDGRNGYAVAKRIEQELPELKSLAESYREQELAYLTARLSRLTREQLVDLSGRYRDRGDGAQATDVVRKWLKAQEPRAAAAGPTELMELGDEYVNLLGDERAAARMYQQAYQQNPQLPTAAEWLQTRGYELTDAEWSKPGQALGKASIAAIELAIQEGRVEVGMTGEQVLQALGTKPSSAIRMASAGQLAEVWVFSDYGISVQLRRISRNETSEVIQVGTVD